MEKTTTASGKPSNSGSYTRPASSGRSSNSSGSSVMRPKEPTEAELKMKAMYENGQLGLEERTYFLDMIAPKVAEYQEYERMNRTGIYSYKDDKGNVYTEEWLITNSIFLDKDSLTQEQITTIMREHNPGLIEKGFDVALYEACQDASINPKILLSTLQWESSWARNGSYDKAFGVGPAGSPNKYTNKSEYGGLYRSIEIYTMWYEKGEQLEKNKAATITVNQDNKFVDQSKGGSTLRYILNNPESKEYFINGQNITPINAAMYARLKYNSWLYYPPSNTHSAKVWHNTVIYGFEGY